MAAAGSEVWGVHASNWLTDSQTAQHRERGREGGWEEPQTQYHSLALGAKFKTRSCKRFVALNSAFAAVNELFLPAAVLFAATKLYPAH